MTHSAGDELALPLLLPHGTLTTKFQPDTLIETAEPLARQPLSAKEANTSDAGKDQVVH